MIKQLKPKHKLIIVVSLVAIIVIPTLLKKGAEKATNSYLKATMGSDLNEDRKELKKLMKEIPTLEGTLISEDEKREQIIQKRLKSFKSIKEKYSDLNLKELEERLLEVSEQAEKAQYIANANKGNLTLEGEIKIRRFFRKYDAINYLYMEKLLEEI